MEIHDLYFNLDRALHSTPRMCNTDGHVLEFHKLFYEVPSPDAAFRALCDLCVTRTPEELRADAELDDAGRMVRAEIPWDRHGHKASPGMSNTLLGQIVINGDRLTAEVNSAEWAEALRLEIDARLGDMARFKVDEIQALGKLGGSKDSGAGREIPEKGHQNR